MGVDHLLDAHPGTHARAEAYLDLRRAVAMWDLAEAALEVTWTIYFVGPVPYRSRGRRPGHRIVVLFNAERLFWITGSHAEGGDAYVDRRPGFWAHRPR